MLRKVLLTLCLCLVVVGFPVLAQDAAPEATAEMAPWSCPAGFEGQTLTWFNWTTYEAENTRSNFKDACGLADVGEAIMGSNEELIAKLGQGNPGYDIVTPTGSSVPQMIREGMLQPLDLSKIPNFANVSEFLKDPVYDPGNMYTIPYQWGTVGIGYNKEAVGKEITSWEDVWSYTGNVAWLEDPRMMLGIALNLLGFDPNTTNEDEIGQARDYLIDHGSNVRTIAVDDGQEKLVSGEADIVIEYSGDIFQKITECNDNAELNCKDKYAYVIPKEGSVVWVDNLAIPTGAPNPELAMAFINYVLDAQVGADISNYTAYASPNQASIDGKLIDESMLTDPIIYPSEETNKVLFGLSDQGDEAARLYNDAWIEAKTALGQ